MLEKRAMNNKEWFVKAEFAGDREAMLLPPPV